MSDAFFVAVEGPIGVGKRATAKALAERLGARAVLEEPEANPFLHDFYRDMRRWALATQLDFLLARHRALDALAERDALSGRVVTDFFLAKESIYADATLEGPERALYDEVAAALPVEGRRPDLVLCLQASTDVLVARLASHRRAGEVVPTREYLDALNDAYNRFFFHYHETPLLVVNTNDVDPAAGGAVLEELVERIEAHAGGTRFYSPVSGVADGG